MRSIIRFVLASLALAAPLSSTQGQDRSVASITPSEVRGIVVAVPVCCRSRLTPAEESHLAQRIAEADVLMLRGSMSAARTVLHQVIADQLRGDAYAAAALRRLANVEFALDRPIVAASVLVELADAAADVADPQTELNALLDAMILYSQNARRVQVRELRPRVRRLLASPAIPEGTRRELARTLHPR